MNTENTVTQVAVNGQDCIGCQRNNRTIMVTMVVRGTEFHDYLLSTEQAEYLLEQLNKKLEENQEG